MIEKNSYELVTSNNMKFVAGVCKQNMENEVKEMKVWDGMDMRELSILYVYVDLGGTRYAISDDGKYVATAQYEDYEEGKLYIYEVGSGKNIFKIESLRKVQWLMFDGSETLMVGTESSGIYFFDVLSGTCKNKMMGKKIYYNRFGENIFLKSKKIIKYNRQVYESSTFTYLCATGTLEGILVSEVNGDLIYYNNDGRLCWRTDCLDLGHFVAIYYDEKKNIVYGVLLNPRKKGDERMHVVTITGDSGEIICVNSIETANYVFVEKSGVVMLVNGKGGLYTFKNNCLEKTTFTSLID